MAQNVQIYSNVPQLRPLEIMTTLAFKTFFQYQNVFFNVTTVKGSH